MFVCRSFEKGDVVGSCYGSMGYGDLGEELQMPKRYVEEYIQVIAESFWR